jgi:hypothetical protein
VVNDEHLAVRVQAGQPVDDKGAFTIDHEGLSDDTEIRAGGNLLLCGLFGGTSSYLVLSYITYLMLDR